MRAWLFAAALLVGALAISERTDLSAEEFGPDGTPTDLGGQASGRRGFNLASGPGTFMVTADVSSNRAGNDEALALDNKDELGSTAGRRRRTKTKQVEKAVAAARTASVGTTSNLEVDAFTGTHCGINDPMGSRLTIKRGVWTWAGCYGHIKRNKRNNHYYLKISGSNVLISRLGGSEVGKGPCDKTDPEIATEENVGTKIKEAKARTGDDNWQSKVVDVVLYNFEGGKATAVTAGDCVDKCKVIPASFKKSLHTLEKYRGTKKDPSSIILKSEKVFCDEGIHPVTNGKQNSVKKGGR